MGLVSSYREQINSFYPVLYIKTLDMTKVLYIVSDNRKTSSLRSAAYEKVEILNGFSSILQAQLLLGINIDTVGKRQNLYFLYEIRVSRFFRCICLNLLFIWHFARLFVPLNFVRRFSYLKVKSVAMQSFA